MRRFFEKYAISDQIVQSGTMFIIYVSEYLAYRLMGETPNIHQFELKCSHMIKRLYHSIVYGNFTLQILTQYGKMSLEEIFKKPISNLRPAVDVIEHKFFRFDNDNYLLLQATVHGQF